MHRSFARKNGGLRMTLFLGRRTRIALKRVSSVRRVRLRQIRLGAGAFHELLQAGFDGGAGEQFAE